DVALLIGAGRKLTLFAPHGGDDLVAGERREGERLDKLLRGAGHDDAHLGAVLLEFADEFGCLVGSDPAADAYGYFLSFCRTAHLLFLLIRCDQPSVGIVVSTPARMPVGQRAVMVLRRV